jgi:transcriptional regulator with XRE-family HTH domain
MTMAAHPIGQAPLRSTVARVASETRLALGLTLDEVADRAAISPAYVWAIERGRANPSLAIVERLLTALRIEIGPILRPPIVHADRCPPSTPAVTPSSSSR